MEEEDEEGSCTQKGIQICHEQQGTAWVAHKGNILQLYIGFIS